MPESVGIIFQTIVNKPMAIFLLLSIAFGYAYWEQNKSYTDVIAEVSGLRAEIKKMNEIIILKVELAKLNCPSNNLDFLMNIDEIEEVQ